MIYFINENHQTRHRTNHQWLNNKRITRIPSLYSSPEGNIRVEVVYEDETFWLPQKRMAELFEVEVNTVN
jgi:hypothetical protein